MNILCVVGTRPEIIKMAPVIKQLRRYPRQFTCRVCVTGQHRELIDPLLKLFGIRVDHDLDLMKKDQSLEHITTLVLEETSALIKKHKIDCVIVQGDTTSATAAALAAFYSKVKVAHVEAGLRTGDKHHPFPEEINRRVIDSLSDLFFAHTSGARRNLLREGVNPRDIDVTGNTVIDILLETSRRKYDFSKTALAAAVRDPRRLILMTAHRRENFGRPIEEICLAVKDLASRYSDKFKFIYPVHLNPHIQKPVRAILHHIPNVYLTQPLEYLPMVALMKQSYVVLTDSGGLQEEAPSLGKPVLVMRKTTERPEGVQAGCVKIIGTARNNIVKSVVQLIEDRALYTRMSRAVNPYGDGKASVRIVQSLRRLSAQYKK